MKKLQQRENWEKVQAGLKDGAPQFSAAYHEKKEKEKKQRLEAVFEQEFMQPEAKEAGTLNAQIQVPKP